MPPQVVAAMQQMAHLPPAQQQALLASIMSHQQRMQHQVHALNQRPLPPGGGAMPPPRPGMPPPPGGPPPGGMPPPPPPGPVPSRPAPEVTQRNPQVPTRIGKRMMGSELQMVMRHQALQLQINDPINDDFYHHFWVVKGGQSRARPLQTRPATISTERKKLDDQKVSQSLGLGGVIHRTPDVAVRTPRKLLVVPGPASPATPAALAGTTPGQGPEAPTGGRASTEGAAPLGSPMWAFRSLIAQARDTLIELRVHASSPAVMTPAGTQLRVALLQKLHAIVRGGSPDGPLNVELFNDGKGRKLLVDILPLWPPQVQAAVLTSFVTQLPACLQSMTLPLPDAPKLASTLASLPKQLPPEETATLLSACLGHSPDVLKQGLERSDVTALVLGLLCCPNMAEACPGPLEAFYGVLVPLGSSSETTWALLDALLPVASQAHAAMLQRALARLDVGGLTGALQAAYKDFSARLQQHIASLPA